MSSLLASGRRAVRRPPGGRAPWARPAGPRPGPARTCPLFCGRPCPKASKRRTSRRWAQTNTVDTCDLILWGALPRCSAAHRWRIGRRSAHTYTAEASRYYTAGDPAPRPAAWQAGGAYEPPSCGIRLVTLYVLVAQAHQTRACLSRLTGSSRA